jgi:hypothetical protein
MEMWGHGAYPLHFMPSQCINIGNNRPPERGGEGGGMLCTCKLSLL